MVHRIDRRVLLLIVLLVVIIACIVSVVVISKRERKRINVSEEESLSSEKETIVEIKPGEEQEEITINALPLSEQTDQTASIELLTILDRQIISGSLVFNFRHNGSFYGFFDSSNVYVDDYKWQMIEDEGIYYIDIIDEVNKTYVRWRLIDEDNTYLLHEASKTIVPLFEE